MKKESFGILLALVAAVISGFAIPANKLFVVSMDPAVFTALRALIIGLVFLLLAGFQSGFDFKRFKGASWKQLAAIGVIGGGIAFLLYFTGLGLTTAGRAAFLHKTLPLFAGIFAAVFLKERLPRRHWYALLAMLIGAFMVYFAAIPPGAWWANPGLGDLLVVGAAILWAVESTIARKVMKDGGSNLMVSFARMFIGAIVLFAAVFLLGRTDALLAISAAQALNIFASTAILFGYVFFWYWSLKHIGLGKASALLLVAPVISLLVGVWWFGEPVPLMEAAGCALILAGAWVVARAKGVHGMEHEASPQTQ